MRHRRTFSVVTACAALTLVAGACTDSSSSDATATSAAPAVPAKGTTATTDAAQTDAAQSNAWALTYTGGKAGAADDSLAPVVIGYVNQEGGVPAFPEATAGTDAEHTEPFQIARGLLRRFQRRRGEGVGLHVGDELLHQSAASSAGHRDGLGERPARQRGDSLEAIVVEQFAEQRGSDRPGASQHDCGACVGHGRMRSMAVSSKTVGRRAGAV